MTILDRFSLEGRVAVVTGAGRGIGAGCAVALAEAGADVLLSSRTEGQLQDVAERIEGLGRRAVVVPADLSDLDAVAALATRAYDELGRLDVSGSVSDVLPLEDVGRGVERLRSKEGDPVRLVVQPWV